MLGRIFLLYALASALFLSTFIHVAAAGFAPSRFEDGPAGATEVPHPESLLSILQQVPVHEPRVFELARKKIQDLESSPQCHQLATSTLIHVCQSFSTLPGQDLHLPRFATSPLEDARKEYATRLAVCELQGIKSGVPRQCAPFLPSYEACRKSRPGGIFDRYKSRDHEPPAAPCYPESTPQQLQECFEAFFASEQRWTSYSNAHSSSLVICQASRGALENDEHLQKLKKATDAQEGASEALSQIIQETNSRLAQHQTFAEAVRKFQVDLAARNEAALSEADTFLAHMVAKFESSARAMFGGLRSSLRATTNEVDALTNNIKDANGGVDDARAALQTLFEEAVRRDGERSALQDLSLKGNQNIATALHAVLENIRDVAVQSLAERVHSVEHMVAQYIAMNQQALDNQRDFLENQTRIMANQIAIETSLAGQQTIIEHNSQKISEMSFDSIGSRVVSWLGLALAVILISKVNVFLATCVAFGAGFAGSLGPETIFGAITSLSAITSLGSSTTSAMTPPERPDNQPTYLWVILIACFIFMGLAIWARLQGAAIKHRIEEWAEPSVESLDYDDQRARANERSTWSSRLGHPFRASSV